MQHRVIVMHLGHVLIPCVCMTYILGLHLTDIDSLSWILYLLCTQITRQFVIRCDEDWTMISIHFLFTPM